MLGKAVKLFPTYAWLSCVIEIIVTSVKGPTLQRKPYTKQPLEVSYEKIYCVKHFFRSTVNLMPDIAIDVDAETSGGQVSTDFVVASVIQGKIPKNRLKGNINGGGTLLKLHTSAGSIRLQKAADAG